MGHLHQVLTAWDDRCYCYRPVLSSKVLDVRNWTTKVGKRRMYDKSRCVRLGPIQGLTGRWNDIIYCSPLLEDGTKQSTVVFFGGDVQDYPEIMEQNVENKKYLQWNLDNCALIMQSHFIRSHIVVVRPSRVEFQVYSCYDNFVESDKMGTPRHAKDSAALDHLTHLLYNAATALKYSSMMKENSWRVGESELMLIGFSKGCVVLNQMILEMYLRARKPGRLVERLRHLFWLDGGHAGTHDTWITSHAVLAALSALDVQIWIHVTPYQVGGRRAVTRDEEQMFHERLDSLGARVERRLYFEQEPPSLDAHFLLLQQFSVALNHPCT